MSGEHVQQTPQEVLRKEKVGQFDRLVLGHPITEIDTDQIISKKVAELLGLIPKGVPIECVPHVNDTQLENKATLTIEGFPATRPGTNTLETGNFHNGPNDEPAAYMLLTSIIADPPAQDDPEYPKKFKDMLNTELGKRMPRKTWQQLENLVGWLAEMDSKGEMKGKIKSLNYPRDLIPTQDLEQFKDVFHAIRDSILADDLGNKEERIFSATDTLFDRLFTPGKERPSLQKLYAAEINAVREEKERVNGILKQNLLEYDTQGKEIGLNGQRLKTTQLTNGISITYVNISGLNIKHGGPRFAVEAVRRHTTSVEHPHGRQTAVLVFVNDEFGEKGEPNGRKKVMIKIPKELHGFRGLDLSELAARLNQSEELFGGGVPLIEVSAYGGHTEVVLSPQFEGSELEPEKLFVDVQSFVDSPRFTESGFAQKAKEIANRLGIENYSTTLDPPRNEYDIAQRAIVIPLEGRPEPIKLYEAELGSYEQAFSDNRNENIRILSQKTHLGEAPEITQIKIDSAVRDLTWYLEEKNAPKLLEALFDLPKEYILKLPAEHLMKIYEVIAADPVAISQVYDKTDNKFGLFRENPAEWMINNPEDYLRNLHFYKSTVQSKVDWAINHALLRNAQLKDFVFQERYVQCLQAILTSETYKNSHMNGASYDSHLNSILYVLSAKNLDMRLRKALAGTIAKEYGPEMKTHWERVIKSNPSAFYGAMSEFSEEFTAIVDAVETSVDPKTIPGIEGSRAIEPTADRIIASLAEQRERGIAQPAITILLRIGGRPIETLVQEKGIWVDNIGTGSATREHIEFSTAEAELVVPRVIKQEGIDTAFEDTEELPYAEAVVRMIKLVDSLDPEPDPRKKAKIRLIRDGFPQSLTDLIAENLSKPSDATVEDLIGDDIRERLYNCYYMQTEATFCERKRDRRKGKTEPVV